MRSVQSVELKEGSQEERLPGFAADFPYIATCAELDKYREPVVPWHWHRAVELFYMESGSLEYTTPHGKWSLIAGCGGMVNSNVLHTTRWKVGGEPNIQLLHLFEPSLIAGEHGSRMEQKYVLPLTSAPGVEMILLRPEDDTQAELLRQIRQAFTLSETVWGYEFRLREALTAVWLELFAMARPVMDAGKANDRSNDQIKEMMIYVQRHYSEHLTVEQIAQTAFISKRACFRLFREKLQMTPVEYIRGIRLQQACRLLAKSNAPITEIALSCGLGSSSYFGKVFREEFGCTPLAYRRRWHDNDISGQ